MEPRLLVYVALVVIVPWVIYGLIRKERRSRLIYLLRIIVPTWIALSVVTAGG